MATIIDYVKWRGDIPFEVSPFNKIDALIFTQISYLSLGDYVPGDFSESVTLEELVKKIPEKRIMHLMDGLGYFINKGCSDILFLCAKSKRFSKIKLTAYRDIFSLQKEEQFAAMTFLLDDISVVTYRGTDETIIGWKEDFNLGYMDEVPAQSDAVAYFREALEKLPGKMILTGHSKGGNEALYASIRCSDSEKERIQKVYNFDGPGLSKEILESEDYRKVEERILSVYPECSIVGMIFNHPPKFEIAKSDEFIVMQHDAFSWEVLGTEFVLQEDFTEESRFFHKTFNEWKESLPPDQIKEFVDTIFGVILNTGATSVNDFNDEKLQYSAKTVHEMHKVDFKKRIEILKVANMFLKAGKGNFPLFDVFKNPLMQ